MIDNGKQGPLSVSADISRTSNMGMGGNMHEFNPARKMLSLDNHIFSPFSVIGPEFFIFSQSKHVRVLYGARVS
jgi:hypothetical protein